MKEDVKSKAEALRARINGNSKEKTTPETEVMPKVMEMPKVVQRLLKERGWHPIGTGMSRSAESSKRPSVERSGKIADLRERELMSRAIYVPWGGSLQQYSSVDELLQKMVQTAAQKHAPVKTKWNGIEFGIEADMPIELALKVWKDKACKPLFEKDNPQVLADSLKDCSKNTRINDTAQSFQEAALAEILVSKHPEHTDELTMLQLLNAMYRVRDEKAAGKIEEALDASLAKYIAGEKTFPITLQNVVTLQKLSDSWSVMKLKDTQKLENRIEQTELEMLKNLKSKDLKGISDKLLADGNRIALKHKDKGDFGKIFQQELVERLSSGKVFDPH